MRFVNQINIVYMIPTKIAAKRGRPKRKNSDSDQSCDEFTKKKVPKKLQKIATATKKALETQKKNKKKAQQRNKIEFSESSESEPSESEEVKEEPVIKVVNVPLQMFKPDKLFAQILNKANKEPEFLIMLRNLLSGCSRILRDKKNFLRKKWQQLRNSNCTQDEYLSRQSELKRMEVQEIYEIEKDIMSKLSYANIKGFESKESIVEEFKSSVENTNKNELEVDYVIEDTLWNNYHELQKKLLSLLMNEKDLVYSTSIDHTGIGRLGSMPPIRQAKSPEDNEMEIKFNNIETQENPQTTQFLFCKHFSEINYDKVFQNYSNPFKLSQSDIYYMDPKALSWILQTKSDQIYTNEKFQRETFKRYNEMIQKIYNNSSELSDETLIEQLLEIAAYILNSVHYYQKFKLKCDLLHPLDLLLVIEKIKKDRKKMNINSLLLEEAFDKQLENLESSMKNISESLNE